MQHSDTSDQQPIVKTDKLTKVFRDFWRRPKVRAVDEIDLEIGRGEIFGLLGPNGSGKSTTIKILLGLLRPTSGNVSVMGSAPKNVHAKQLIGYLPEDSHLYNYLTPRETLDFYGKLFDMTRSQRIERITQLLDMVGLTHASSRRVGEFSKGMARRIGLAQALINNPQLIVLDEPTSGLDPMGCRQVKDLMLTLARQGKTVILSSHLLADVEDVCDRVAILYNGKIRATGKVNQLLEKRDNTRFTVPSLPPGKINEILTLLKDKIGTDPKVDHPAMNLEQFFLDVVQEAHRNTGSSVGKAGSDNVAYYLTHE
ncbi:MAG: ABC transporter ATP-binding protein [Lentisphaerae bacterium]|nr:ABC transporter ATP-binding protein [Lentisphaerota bacterium]